MAQEQIQRQWNLLLSLQTRGEGIPLADLAAEFEVSERTIQRDLELLVDLGFPITFETDVYGKRFWRMPPNFMRNGGLTLTMTEALSLHIAERQFMPLAGTSLAEGLASLLQKIRVLIPQRARDYFRDLNSIVCVRPTAATDYSQHAESIRLLDEAIRECRTVNVSYRSLWRADQYETDFDPYGLVLHQDDLFLVGHSHRADGLRVFKVSRILNVRRAEGTFERPADFNLEELFRNSFGIVRNDRPPQRVVVQFTGPAAGMVEERIWHDSQKVQWLPPEGSLFEQSGSDPDALQVTFELAELVELKRWLMSFGDQAVVVSPEWFRAEVREELLRAAARYAE